MTLYCFVSLQELEQARPAEEIWLDALITVLEEALSSSVATFFKVFQVV